MGLWLPAAVLLAAAAGSEPPRVPEPPPVTGAEDPKVPERREPPALEKARLKVSAESAERKALPAGKDGATLSLVTFERKVTATRGKLKLTCRRLEVTFSRPPARGAEKPKTRALRARASGEVVIRTPRRKAVAENADYHLADERFELTGKKRPVIFQDGDAVAAESFAFRRRDGVFEARGRTSAVILPRKKPGGKPGKDRVPPDRSEKAVPGLTGKTRIDAAGGAVYQEGRRRLFLRKQVLVRQKGLRLYCDRLWVLFAPAKREKKPAPNAGGPGKPGDGKDPLTAAFSPGSVTRVIAAGNVRVVGEDRSAEAEIAAYDPAKRSVTLGGKKRAPVIRDGENYLTAPLIVYHLATGRIESPGGKLKIVVREEKPGSSKLPGSR
jgi:lipopolysaccharide export system protein LptA